MERQSKSSTSLSRLVTTVNRGTRTRKTPNRQPSVAPSEDNPLQTPIPKCSNERVKVKPVSTSSVKLTYDQKRKLSELARRREAELPFVEIEEVFLTIFSTKEIKAMAVTEVNNTERYGPGSVDDPQMGVTDNTSLCPTCSRDNVNCPGHPGYIQLPEPMCHPLLLREIIAVLNCICNDCGGLLLTRDEIVQRKIHRLTGAKRLNALEKASIGLACRREPRDQARLCIRNPNYKTKKTQETSQIMYEYVFEGETKEDYRSAQEILDIFNSISMEDAELMGYQHGAHPTRLIMEVIMVIPPVARPPTVTDGKAMEDPLTAMYIDIVRQVKALRNFIEGSTEEEAQLRRGKRKPKKQLTLQEVRKNLYDRVKHFINNTDGWYTAGGQPFTSISELVQGKEGLIRGNMMAKRVDFSARTVLSPDPSLATGQVSIPKAIAMILGPKVRVNRYNHDELQKLLVDGRVTYITFSEKAEKENSSLVLAGARIQVTEKYRKNYVLQDGDYVERWMQDGDIVIFNRQPTLHKYSLMGYRAVIRDQKTIGLALPSTTPANADFDGDEGNVHIEQVLDARAEAGYLMNVESCLINQQSNKPTMGVVFNGPLAAMSLTRPETTVPPGDFFDALTWLTHREQLGTLKERMEKYSVPYTLPVEKGRSNYIVLGFDPTTQEEILSKLYLNDDGILVYYEQVDGKDVMYSTDLPNTYDPEGRIADFNPTEGTYTYPDNVRFKIEYEEYYTGRALFSALLPEDFYYEGPKGVIIQQGVLTSGIITKAHIGPERDSIIHIMAMNYPSSRVAQFITDANHVLDRWFEGEGFSIGLSSCFVNDSTLNQEIQQSIDQARLSVSAMGTKPSDPIEAEKWEKQILAYIGGPADKIGRKIQASLPSDNALNMATLSGAKGKASNMVQIAAFLGQQHIGSKRPKQNITDESRCLPWFYPHDESLEASGFCTSSFLKGMTPSEMYFHQMAGRVGLLGTALTTSDTGFMHRKAVMVLQDIKAAYDGSIRNVDNTIFEYVYGDDGFAPDRLIRVKTKKSEFLSFIDVDNVAKQLNQRYGY